MANKQFKQFSINTLSDALLALNALISPSISNLNKFEVYSKEAVSIRDHYQDGDLIPSDVYEAVHDKTLFCQRELLEYMADETKDTFSYKSLRKTLIKKGFLVRQLDQDTVEILNELHIIRNWTFHNVQSRLVAEKEVMQKTIPSEYGGVAEIEPQLNPIVVVKYKAYTKDVLESFIHHNLTRSAQFSIILEEMKRDYQDMYDQLDNPKMVSRFGTQLLVDDCKSITPVRTTVYEQIYGSKGNESDIPNLSMAIQKGKYDGTQESFDKYTERADK